MKINFAELEYQIIELKGARVKKKISFKKKILNYNIRRKLSCCFDILETLCKTFKFMNGKSSE